MQITLETAATHTIQAYSKDGIQINSIHYEQSLIVSREEIISDLAIKKIEDIDSDYLALLNQAKPDVIILGHEQAQVFLKLEIIKELRQQGIGIECMSIGAACRTFNVLLSEGRAVVLGLIIGCASQYWR